MELTYILTFSALASVVSGTCTTTDWSQSFARPGVSQCQWNTYLRGFGSSGSGTSGSITGLQSAQCCPGPDELWTWSDMMVVFQDWRTSFDVKGWVSCPAGFFLHGLVRSGSGNGQLHNIEEGRCSKPTEHPRRYGECYEESVASCFLNGGLCGCREGYFVTGLYRDSCSRLECLEKLKCCKMLPEPDVLNELERVKTRIMDKTLADIALLAHWLGYGWCAGCRAMYVGEDFRRIGDAWYADTSGTCEGYMSGHRLSIHYSDWRFKVKNMIYGERETTILHPEKIDTGVVINNHSTPVTKTIEQEEVVVRSVKHTASSEWRHIQELNISVTYKTLFSMRYRFRYETASSTTNETGVTDSNTFKVTSSKTLQPYSSAKWQIEISKARTAVAYTAVIEIEFSLELRGFLRWGGGYNGDSTNYHYRHRGSGDRPTFHYRFGNSSRTFREALTRESETNMSPWEWDAMLRKYPHAVRVIDRLVNENRYEFQLTGYFEDIFGKNANLEWSEMRKRKRSTAVFDEKPISPVNHVIAKEGVNDPASLNHFPPELNIPRVRPTERDHIPASGF
ncbi:uncharacterized protein LOC131936552 [Physella acuta]|uniref:uncharacterized protein LOC131936552 n=1 Tax=Physella acuta TaxID=109671 RepID=UPI0027DBF742|nr:uncharacterized protein LOC131936552 [Physella acuta]